MRRYFYLLPILILLAWFLPNEFYKWRLAWAQVQLADGNVPTARKQLEALSEEQPGDLAVQLTRLQALVESEDLDATETFLTQLNSRFANDAQVQLARANAYHELGLHQKSYRARVELYEAKIKKLLSNEADSESWSLLVLNSLAYSSFLANEDTDVWYDQLRKNLNATEDALFAIYLSEGFRLVQQPRMAADTILAQLDHLENVERQQEARWRQELRIWMSDRNWPIEEPPSLAMQRQNLTNLRELMGRLGQQGWHVLEGTNYDDFRQYRERFDKPRYKSNRIAQSVMDLSPMAVCRQLDHYSQIYDTRGSLAMQIGDMEQAQRDLNQSVLAVELLRSLAKDAGYWESFEIVDIQTINKHRAASRHGFAVIYYHRAQLLERLQQHEAAQRDLKQIADLGFQADDQLY